MSVDIEDLTIIWHGQDKTTWNVCGEGCEDQGVFLDPKASNIIDAPVQTLWVKGPFGSKYQGAQVQRRDPVLSFSIYGETVDEFLDNDSNFRMSWDYENEGYLEFIDEVNGTSRKLGLRLLEQPKAYEGDRGGGYAPQAYRDAQVIITAAAENPFYVGPDVVQEFVVPTSSGTVTDFFYMRNDGDTEMWPWWSMSASKAGLRWVVPDFSWGQEDFRRGVADAARSVAIPPLMLNEHVTAVSHPDEEYLLSSLDTNPWNRSNGNELQYPVPRWTPKTFVPVSWSGANPGDVIRLHKQCQYSRPWGVRR